MAQTDALTIPQGATFTVYWDLIDADTGQLVTDTTGFEAAMQIRPAPGSATLLYAFPAPSFDGARVTFTASATDTTAMDFGRASYDVLVTDASGVRTRIVEGTVSLDRAVTTA